MAVTGAGGGSPGSAADCAVAVGATTSVARVTAKSAAIGRFNRDPQGLCATFTGAPASRFADRPEAAAASTRPGRYHVDRVVQALTSRKSAVARTRTFRMSE